MNIRKWITLVLSLLILLGGGAVCTRKYFRRLHHQT